MLNLNDIKRKIVDYFQSDITLITFYYYWSFDYNYLGVRFICEAIYKLRWRQAL